MSEVVSLLKAARALISDPDKWTQGVFARNKEGSRISSTSPEATCWCASGAVNSIGFGSFNIRCGTLDAMEKHGFGDSIEKFNDTHTHTEVLAEFDNVIAAIERSQ